MTTEAPGVRSVAGVVVVVQAAELAPPAGTTAETVSIPLSSLKLPLSQMFRYRRDPCPVIGWAGTGAPGRTRAANSDSECLLAPST